MSWRTWRSCAPVGAFVATLVGGGVASVHASEPEAGAKPATVPAPDAGATARKSKRFWAFELQGMLTAEMIPTTFFGGEGAFVVGNDNFFLRVGGAVLGARSFSVGQGEVANTLQYGLADACAGKTRRPHRIRMCVGAEVGAWAHLWTGYSRPGHRYSPHVAGALKADYQYQVTDRFGLLFGVGVSVPAIGASFRGTDQQGRPTALLIPGPVAGTARLGVSFRFR